MKQHILIFLLFCTTSTHAQNPQPNPLIGTWRLIEFADLDPATGKWTYDYGQHPKGYFTYTKTGIITINISSTVPLKMSADSAKKFYPNLYNYIQQTALGYFGHYTINWKTSTVVHHVEGGTIPYYTDTDQPRPFTLKNDTLIIGDNKTWRRVLVRAD